MTARQPENKVPVFESSGQRIGDYQLGSIIGGGGMGTVYLAKQISLQRLVAVKVLLPELTSDPVYMARFFQEVRLMAKMEHPDLVRAYEAGMDKGLAYFAMEYVPGTDLRTELIRKKRFSEQDVLTIAEHTAIPLQYAWERFRIIHRDIKPANIMRTADGSGFRLLDLGISKQIAAMQTGNELTETHTMVGSPTYISPEQARSQKDIDFRTDIYSLGVTMYHLLAGEPPYDSPSPMEVIAMHFKMPVPDIRAKAPGVSRQTAMLLKHMMAKDPEDRPATWDEAIGMIRDASVREEKRTASRKMPAMKDAEEKHRSGGKQLRRIVLLSVLSAAAAALLLSLFFSKNDRKEVPPEPAPAAVQAADGDKTLPAPVQTADPDERREQELRLLARISGAFESKGDYAEALAVWEKYRPPEDLKDDPGFKRRIRDQIEYLKKRVQQQKKTAADHP